MPVKGDGEVGGAPEASGEQSVNDFDELRALVREDIRDVLPKELAVRETVNLSTDDDLPAFVARLVDLDPGQREELRSRRKTLRLATPAATAVPAARAVPSAPSARTVSSPTV